VKFGSRQTENGDLIRSVAVVRLAVVKLQHAWQGLTPLGGGHLVLPIFGPHGALEGFSASPKPRQTMPSYAFESEPLHGHSRVPFRCLRRNSELRSLTLCVRFQYSGPIRSTEAAPVAKLIKPP